jgi:hypothetical protein
MLPATWVDQMFARLSVRYGSAWAAKWRDLDVAAVKADWARELAGFKDQPDAIGYALENLPAFPPTVTEFRAIARRTPASPVPRLEAPVADPGLIEAELSKLRSAAPSPHRDGRDWARLIVARKERGEYVSPSSYRLACEVLNVAPKRDA